MAGSSLLFTGWRLCHRYPAHPSWRCSAFLPREHARTKQLADLENLLMTRWFQNFPADVTHVNMSIQENLQNMSRIVRSSTNWQESWAGSWKAERDREKVCRASVHLLWQCCFADNHHKLKPRAKKLHTQTFMSRCSVSWDRSTRHNQLSRLSYHTSPGYNI